MQMTSSPPVKFGLIVPGANPIMQKELTAWFPPGSTSEVRGIPSPSNGTGLVPDTIPAYHDSVRSLAETLDKGMDRVVYGCTAGAFIAGVKEEGKLAEDLTKITGRPSVTTGRAMADVLTECGARRVAVLSPYSEETNRFLEIYLGSFGIAIENLARMDLTPYNRRYADIKTEDVLTFARGAMTDRCDALFIVCSLLPTYAALGTLRQEFGRPVWSSISGTAWKVLRSLGLPMPDAPMPVPAAH